MPISQQGAINKTAQIVPDVYVQIVAPRVLLLNGVPTNILGMVGTAQWGPVNAPVTIGSMAETTSAACGSQMARIRRPGLNYCQRKRTVRLKSRRNPKRPKTRRP